MKKSFSLIETIVAISILTIGILGISFLISSQIASIHFSENKLIAAYLAQEGIEIVRNIRDTNWLKGESWDSNLDTSGTPRFNFDWRSQKIPDDDNCSGKNYLKFNSFLYECSLDSPNKLQRKIQISHPGGNNDIMEIKIIVSWREKGKTHKYSLTGRLYNWRK